MALLVATLACVLAIVGYVVCGWRFGDASTNLIPFAVVLVAVAVAVVATVHDNPVCHNLLSGDGQRFTHDTSVQLPRHRPRL